MKTSFTQRIGINSKAPIASGFPDTAKTALLFILKRFVSEDKVRNGDSNKPWELVVLEMLRTIRQESVPSEPDAFPNLPEEDCREVLKAMTWTQVYTFCERFYAQLLNDKGYWDDGDWVIKVPVSSVREDFTGEINNLISEENLSFVFEDGEFRRAGRPQTQKNISRMNAVLTEPRLDRVKKHFQKAYGFFSAKEPDNENALKEAVTGIEAAIEIMSGHKVSQDFAKGVQKLSDDGVPAVITQVFTKLYACRGSASGAAHANTTGGFAVGSLEAELVLSLSAAVITYVVDHYNSRVEEPLF